ncbi:MULTISPECIES: acylneuraminate cytidylyltransferase family protein [unclassified Herbaspirillum]|uniref:acylneuraminate cytidylyltransferase family protein n=1 Tax=unclassified Herbaspirillum TaxID=2624150 RepID=UPI000552D73E|nr:MULTISPECIES: acylneuraminate cytidylyltransferase family protein [unclassified Herbaspirillum]NUT60281.1 acylneuraminate cytidylyltransferase family protein [Herbaspirillum sp. C9C3]
MTDIQDHRIVAIIPARGGSKGIPKKNIHMLAGKPLITHTIEQALHSELVSLVVVSTDDERIAEISRMAGAQVIHRPVDLSNDTASSESALVHAIKQLANDHDISPELVVFLQCTSPLRHPHDIDRAIRTLREKGADSLLSVSPSHRFLWEEHNGEARSLNYDYRQRPRRQDMAPQFAENGSIYVFRPEQLLASGNRLSGKIALYKMDEDAALDIDSLVDMQIAEALLAGRRGLK